MNPNIHYSSIIVQYRIVYSIRFLMMQKLVLNIDKAIQWKKLKQHERPFYTHNNFWGLLKKHR